MNSIPMWKSKHKIKHSFYFTLAFIIYVTTKNCVKFKINCIIYEQ